MLSKSLIGLESMQFAFNSFFSFLTRFPSSSKVSFAMILFSFSCIALAAAAVCPTANFASVSSFSAGPGYPAPSMSVACSSGQVTVSSNNIPPFTFVAKTPNGLSSQTFTLTFPQNPTFQSPPTTIVNVLGTLGVTTTGLSIFGPTEGPTPAAEA